MTYEHRTAEFKEQLASIRRQWPFQPGGKGGNRKGLRDAIAFRTSLSQIATSTSSYEGEYVFAKSTYRQRSRFVVVGHNALCLLADKQ